MGLGIRRRIIAALDLYELGLDGVDAYGQVAFLFDLSESAEFAADFFFNARIERRRYFRNKERVIDVKLARIAAKSLRDNGRGDTTIKDDLAEV